MIECPKCGFTQPEDPFCAKCGVDIELYKLKQKNSPQEVARNPLLYAGVVGILVVVGLFYLRSPLNSFRNMVRGDGPVTFQNRSGSDEFENSSETENSEGSNRLAQTNLQQGSQQPGASGSFSSKAASGALANQTLSSTATAGTAQAPLQGAALPLVRLQSIFFEADVKEVEAFLFDMQSSGQIADFGDYKSGLIANRGAFVDRFRQDFSARVAHASTQVTVQPSQPVANWKVPGFNLNISSESFLNSSLSGRIELAPYPVTSFQVFVNQSKADATPSQAWLILVDLKPRLAQLMALPEKWGPLKIINTPSFRDRPTYLGIFVDFQ